MNDTTLLNTTVNTAPAPPVSASTIPLSGNLGDNNTFPSIDNDGDFRDALDVYSRMTDYTPVAQEFEQNLNIFRRKSVLSDFRDPYADEENRVRREKYSVFADMATDWKTDSGARERVVKKYGEDFAKKWEAAPEDDREYIGGMKLLDELYRREGDRELDPMWHYIEENGLKDVSYMNHQGDVWKDFKTSLAPKFAERDKALLTNKSFIEKAPLYFEERLKGKGTIDALESIPDLTDDEKFFAMSNFGVGSEWEKSMERAKSWMQKNGYDHTISEDEIKAKADELKSEHEAGVDKLRVALGKGYLDPGKKDWRNEAITEIQKGKSINTRAMSVEGISTNEIEGIANNLIELRKSDPQAHDMVMSLYEFEAKRAKENGTPFVSPFFQTLKTMGHSAIDSTSMMILNKAPSDNSELFITPAGEAGLYSFSWSKNGSPQYGSIRSRETTKELSELKGILSDIANSPEGAGFTRRTFDGLGKMAAQTAIFLGTRGAGTFAAVGGDRFNELYGNGGDYFSSLLRGAAAGGVEVAIERIGGESLFRTTKLLRNVPLANKVTRYFGGVGDAVKRGLYGNATARAGGAMLAAGGSEWMEEFMSPTLLAPIDAATAALFGQKDGMTKDQWWSEIKGVADPELGFQMLLFGAVAGGAQIPAFAQQARISRMGSMEIMGLGIDRESAVKIADIVDPIKKSDAILKAREESTQGAESELRNVREGLNSIDDYNRVSSSQAWKNEVELLNLPVIEEAGNGNYTVRTGIKQEDGSTKWSNVEHAESEVIALLQNRLDDSIRARMIESAENAAVNATVDKLKASGKYIFEDMREPETVASARKLASAAQLIIDSGVDPNSSDPSLGSMMPLGTAVSHGQKLEERMNLAVERGEISSVENGISRAHRVAMKNGQTLIRYAKGKTKYLELVEEVLETNIIEDMQSSGHTQDWYWKNLVAVQNYLKENGYLKKEKRLVDNGKTDYSVRDIIEGLSMLSKGDFLARAHTMNMPEWIRDFLMLVRQWVSSAFALAELGKGLHEMEKSGKLDGNFAKAIRDIGGSFEEYWRAESEVLANQERAEINKRVKGSFDEDTATTFSVTSIPSSDICATAEEMKEKIKPLQGRTFTNKETGLQARISSKTKGKAQQAQMSIANLKRFDIPADQARAIHYTAAARVNELFENAEDAFFEEAYKNDPSKSGAYHLFNSVDIEGIGVFDVNITAVSYRETKDGNVIYSLELTIENPEGLGVVSHTLSQRGATSSSNGASRNLASYRSFVEKEKLSLKKKAISDGTFLKSPNGKDSKLTEDEWLTVRTKAFKNWFGDWENDPTNSSKVLDENSEPMLVYHRSFWEFTEFDPDMGGDNFDRGEDKGFLFFARKESDANQALDGAIDYARNSGKEDIEYMKNRRFYKCFINLRNPLASNKYDHWDFDSDKIQTEFYDGDADGNEYDGIILDNSDMVIAIRSNQIKSATDNRGTFDPESGDITFSVAEKMPDMPTSRSNRANKILGEYAKVFREEHAAWGRYSGKTDQAEFLVNMGKVTSLAKDCLMFMRPKKRRKLQPMIDRLVMASEMAATGRISETAFVNASARRDLNREAEVALDSEIKQLILDAKSDLELARNELLAERKGELDEKIEEKYRALDYQDRVSAKKLYNERNKNIISIRKKFKKADYIAKRIRSENEKLETALSKLQTRQEKLESNIEKLEKKKEGLRSRKISNKEAKDHAANSIQEARKAWATGKIDELLQDAVDAVGKEIESIAKEDTLKLIKSILESGIEIKKKNSKQLKGKMSIDALRFLQGKVKPWMEMSAEEKEAEINRLEKELQGIDELVSTGSGVIDEVRENRRDELSEELIHLELYGALDSMSLEDTEAALRSLENYIRNEKDAWTLLAEQRKAGLNSTCGKIVSTFNRYGKKANENTLRAASRLPLADNIAAAADVLESMPQLIGRLKRYKALEGWAGEFEKRLADANSEIKESEMKINRALKSIYEARLTKDVLKSRKCKNVREWMVRAKESVATDIVLNKQKKDVYTLDIETLRELSGMSDEQINAWNKMRSENSEKQIPLEDVKTMLANLSAYDEAYEKATADGKNFRFRKSFSVERVGNELSSDPLVMSRSEMTQIILTSEQERYPENLARQGFTPEVIAKLRDIVGEEMIEIGYDLRNILKEEGDKIALLYEKVYGVPFPREINYFPARFKANEGKDESGVSEMLTGVPMMQAGGKQFMIMRVDHSRDVRTDQDMFNVFFESMAMTEHWYHTQSIVSDFHYMLSRPALADSLKANLGEDGLVRLKSWLTLLERSGVEYGKAMGSASRVVGAIYTGKAKAILAFRVETMLKQASAIMNAWAGDESIGFFDYIATMIHMKSGKAKMGVIKMMKSNLFQSRLTGTMIETRLAKMGADMTFTQAETFLTWGMSGMEYADVFSNAIGSAALWNIKYRQAIKSGLDEAAAEVEAWSAVKVSMSKSAQPGSWYEQGFGKLKSIPLFGKALYFMMTESFQKAGLVFGHFHQAHKEGYLTKKGMRHLSRAAQIHLTFGAFNSAIGMLLDMWKDDDDEWENREWMGYVYAALAGSLNGMPVVGELVELALKKLGMKVYTGSSGKAIIDLDRGYKGAENLFAMMTDDADYSWNDYVRESIRLSRLVAPVGGVATLAKSNAIQFLGQWSVFVSALLNLVKTTLDYTDARGITEKTNVKK